MAGTEAIFGELLGDAMGIPGLGPVFGGINEGSRAILHATDGVPVIGDIAHGVDSVMHEVKSVPVLGDIVDALFKALY